MTDDHGQTPMTDDEIEAASLGAAQQVNGQVTLGEYDPHWPAVYEREAALIDARLDERPSGGGGRHRLEHVGSTSVPGLPAKPVIDMLLTVADPGDEAGYVPALEAAGYTVAIREPDWYEHRVLRKRDLGGRTHPEEGAPEPHFLGAEAAVRAHVDAGCTTASDSGSCRGTYRSSRTLPHEQMS
ncbi:GrpB family protein [Streptomyces niveus]|uniref:GrpB family protein n=1 Tax=Streptomyces niveus TaxID=193462 RepID=UPI00342D1C15